MLINFYIEFWKEEKKVKKSISCGSIEKLEEILKKENETFDYKKYNLENQKITFTFILRNNNSNGTAGLYNAFLGKKYVGSLFVPYNIFNPNSEKFYITFWEEEIEYD